MSLAGGNLALTSGASHLEGNLWVGAGRTLSVAGDDASLTVNGDVGLTNANLIAASGGHVTLLGFGSFQKASGCGGDIWQATGVGSELRLPALTNLIGGDCGALTVRAENGGAVAMPVLRQVGGFLSFDAWGTNSLVDLPATDGQPSEGWLNFNVQSGGQVRAGFLRSYAKSPGCGGDVWQATGIGSELRLPALTNLIGGDCGALTVRAEGGGTVLLTASAGQSSGFLTFEALAGGRVSGAFVSRHTKPPGCGEQKWVSAGVGSMLEFPALTDLTGGDCGWLHVRAESGAQLQFAKLMNISGLFSVEAVGVASLVALPSFRQMIAHTGTRFLVTAQDGGRVDLRSLELVAGESCTLRSVGMGSSLDLTGLGAFATTLGTSELKAVSGGVISLASPAILLVNVAAQVPDHPVLPATIPASMSIALYGQPWRSYQVDICDLHTEANTWRTYSRVAQTEVLHVLGQAQPWQAFRVQELAASPAILELRHAGPGQVLLVLFGTTNQAYSFEASKSLYPPPLGWLPWGESTGTMTNTFRILPGFVPDGTSRFFRAKQD